MKIATWNIERLKKYSLKIEIETILNDINADILVLTETDTQINLINFPYQLETDALDNHELYKNTERKVIIYSKFEIVNKFEIYDSKTSLCVEVKTDMGNLIVYGTIIGIFGNRSPNFKEDLNKQIYDFKILKDKGNFCVIGDFNISFIDNYYFTKYGRELLNDFFNHANMSLTSKSELETIDHIAVSNSFLKEKSTEIIQWNLDKKLSDHKGIALIF